MLQMIEISNVIVNTVMEWETFLLYNTLMYKL